MCPLYRDVRFIEIFLKIVWLQSKTIRSSSYCPSYRGVRFIVCPLYRDSTVQWMLAYLTIYVNTSVNILKIWTVHAEPSGHSDIGHHPRYRNDIADKLSMKHMTMSIYDINLKWSWDWTIQTLMPSWRCLDNGRYPVKKNASGSYTSSVSPKIMPRLYCCNWKIKASGDFFQLLLRKKNFFFSKQR